MQNQGAMSYLDLIIAVLQEHEKKLDEIIDRLEKAARILESFSSEEA